MTFGPAFGATFVTLYWFAIGLFCVAVVFGFIARTFFKKNREAMAAANLVDAAGLLCLAAFIAVTCALCAPRLLNVPREEYGELVWFPRIGAAVMAAAAVVIPWLAVSKMMPARKKRP